MKTVLLGERPAAVEEFLQQRHALGQDGFDEVWEGVYHVAPMAHPRHGLVSRRLRWWRREGTGYVETPASQLLGVSAGEIAAQIDWPR